MGNRMIVEKSGDNSFGKVAAMASARYIPPHIRPLAVSPLADPECVPTPWGFSFSGSVLSPHRFLDARSA